MVLINKSTMPLYHHRASNSQQAVGTGIIGNTSVGRICKWHTYINKYILPTQALISTSIPDDEASEGL
jgi:hypothetical protein